MSRKANPTLIGLFVLLGVSLAVGAVLLFSSSHLFTKTARYLLYFDASLTGLDPGAAVKFRGVTIGSVKEILIHYNQAPEDTAIPVIIELSQKRLNKRSDETFSLIGEEHFKSCLTRGLRGKLEPQSLLTGLLYVELDFFPGTPERWHQVQPIYLEIPTAPSELQIFQMDFAAIAQKLNSVLGRVDASLAEFQAKDVSRGLTNLLARLNALVGSPELTNTMVSARETLDEVRELSRTLRARADSLSRSAEGALAESRETLREVRSGVQDVRDTLAPAGALRRDVSGALEDLSEAARSVNDLAEFLNRHPNALLSGRRKEDSKP